MKIKNYLTGAIVLIIALKPQIVSYLPYIGEIYYFLRLACVVALFIVMIKRKNKISRMALMMLLYFIYVFLMTVLLNRGDAISYIGRIMGIPVLILYFEIVSKDNIKQILRLAEAVMFVYLIINIFFVAMNIKLGDNIYFLGIRTRFTDVVFPYLYICILRYFVFEKRYVKLLVSVIISLVTINMVSISTAIGGICIFAAVLIYLLVSRKRAAIVRGKIICIISVAVSLAIVFFGVQSLFSFIIEDGLGKQLTFTGRTYIWESTIESIKSHLVFGSGHHVHGVAKYRGLIWPAHNQILETVSEGGLVGLLLMAGSIYFCIRTIKEPNRENIVSLAMISTLLFMMTFEIYLLYPYVYLIFLTTYHINKRPKLSKTDE